MFKFIADSATTNGTYNIDSLFLEDIYGNEVRINSGTLYDDFNVQSFITVVGGIENDPPVLLSISLDKSSLDVSESADTATWTVSASDESGVDWSQSKLFIIHDTLGQIYKYGSADTPGLFKFIADSATVIGTYHIDSLFLEDIYGNEVRINSGTLYDDFDTFRCIAIFGTGLKHDALDFDGNASIDALTDGLLALRYHFGLSGDTLITGIVDTNGQFTSAHDIERRISGLGARLDIDNNCSIDALTDGILTLRYMFGLTGQSLVEGVVAPWASRAQPSEIEAYLKLLIPNP